MLNLKKEDWVRFGVISLIVIFALSTVAVYIGSYSGGSSQPQDTGTVITGYASANATLVSYDPSLDVVGDNAALTSLLKQLKSQNIVVQDISTTDGRLVVLSDPSYVFNVSRMIEAIGLKAYADAIISTGPVSVAEQSGTLHTVNSSTIRQKMAPVFLPGDVFGISFNAEISNSNLYATGNINIAPGPQLSAEVMPDNATLNSTSLAVIIPWEQRYLNSSAFNSSIKDFAQASYSPRSFVAFSEQLPQATLQQISLSNPDYILSVQPNLISIKPSFEDKAKVMSDLASYGATPVFPDSAMQILPATSNSSLDVNRAELAFTRFFPNVSENFTTVYAINVYLPAQFSSGGKTYVLTDRNAVANSIYPPSPNGTVSIVFNAIGNRVIQFQVQSYNIPQSEVPTPIAPTPENSTTPTQPTTNPSNATTPAPANASNATIQAPPKTTNTPNATTMPLQSNSTASPPNATQYPMIPIYPNSTNSSPNSAAGNGTNGSFQP